MSNQKIMANKVSLSGRVDNIQSMVEKVIGMHEKQKLKNDQLKKENAELSLQLEESKRLNQSLEEKNKTIKLAQSLSETSEGSHEMKLKINEYVREIDKCISFLNK